MCIKLPSVVTFPCSYMSNICLTDELLVHNVNFSYRYEGNIFAK